MTDEERASEESLNRLWQSLEKSTGRELESELSALALSARTFKVNTRILREGCLRFENAFPNELMQPGKRRELWEYGFEVVRLFQNAMASGHSFLEHCRRSVVHRYRRHPFLSEFESAYAAEIEASPVCMFVKELRNFLLHRESITPGITRSLIGPFSDAYDSMCSISLSTRGMEAESGRWQSQLAKDYLKRLRGSINVRRLLDEYANRVKEFGDWLLRREREINAATLAEMEESHARLRSVMGAKYPEDIAVFREGAKVDSWFS